MVINAPKLLNYSEQLGILPIQIFSRQEKVRNIVAVFAMTVSTFL